MMSLFASRSWCRERTLRATPSPSSSRYVQHSAWTVYSTEPYVIYSSVSLLSLPFQVKISSGGKVCDKEPYECESGDVATVTVTFHAHYGEPPLDLPLTLSKVKGQL